MYKSTYGLDSTSMMQVLAAQNHAWCYLVHELTLSELTVSDKKVAPLKQPLKSKGKVQE